MSEAVLGIHTFTVYQSANGYTVGKYRTESNGVITIVGQALPEIEDVPVSFTGEWKNDKKFGRQFVCSNYEIQKPTSEKGMISYLTSLKCGIGKIWAKKIYKKFGADTWNVLENNPDRLLEMSGFGKKKLDKLIAKLKQTHVQRAIMAILSGVVEIQASKVERIAAVLGENAPEVIKNNPYELINVHGLGFFTVEKVSKALKANPEDTLRIKGCAYYVLDVLMQKGHTCINKQRLIRCMLNVLNKDYFPPVVSAEKCTDVIATMINERQLMSEYVKGENGKNVTLIYTPDSYFAETAIERNITRIQKSEHELLAGAEAAIDEFSKKNSFQFADCQKQAILNALKYPVSIITGGPGTGKTTCEKAMLWIYNQISEEPQPLLLAPTGRAARRMSEQTGYCASTVHSAIGYINDEETGKGKALIDSLDAKLIIVDEMSMMDQFVTASLLEAVKSDCRIVFIGDPYQLPSVGAGNVLADMIASGVIPTTKLDVIYRQGENSPIITNAEKILNNDTELDYSKGFAFIPESSDNRIFAKACAFYLACVKKFGLDNVTLLTPWRQKGALCVNAFNEYLHDKLNERKAGELTLKMGETEFRIGDKVMQTKNTPDAKNGDIGYIKNIYYGHNPSDDTDFTVICSIDFNNGGTIVEYTKDEMKSVIHAYASTVHKAQGSEYQTVIIITAMSHKISLRRDLIYTAITRATDNVAIIGQQEALKYAINNDKTDTRVTYLRHRLTPYTYCATAPKEEHTPRYEQLGL